MGKRHIADSIPRDPKVYGRVPVPSASAERPPSNGLEPRVLAGSGTPPYSISAETRSLLESIPVEFEPGQLEFDLPKEILEVAAEIADGSDVVGLERARLERLVRVVIAMDRLREDR